MTGSLAARLLLLTLVLTVAGCGFQLRGSSQFPVRFNPVFVDAGELQSDQLGLIRNALTRASAQLVNTPQQSNRLHIHLHPLRTRRIASSSPGGVELVQLALQLDYRLDDSSGATLLDTRTLNQSSEIELDSNNVLAHQQLLEQGRMQLQRNLVQAMIFQLSRE